MAHYNSIEISCVKGSKYECDAEQAVVAAENFFRAIHAILFKQDLRKKIRPSTGSGRAVSETPISSSVRGEPVEPRCVSPVKTEPPEQHDELNVT